MNAYFIYDCYDSAGRPKAEEAVMAYAKANYMYTLIDASELENVVNDLKAYMGKRLDENRRWSTVDISLAKELYEGYRIIHVGRQSLGLRKVKAYIEEGWR